MADWIDTVTAWLAVLKPFDYFTLALNLFVFAFSKQFATQYGRLTDRKSSRVRLRLLRRINLVLFSTYFVAVILQFKLASAFSQTFLVVLCGYLLMHFTEAMVLARYGREITVEERARKVETYTSRTLELIGSVAIVLVALVLLINIWGFKEWLEATSVIGFLALVFYATKDYWVGDFLSGIIVMGDRRIERGNVIRIQDEDLLGIVLQIRSVQTVVRDLVRGHDITIPNSYLVKKRVDIYKTDLNRGISDYVELKVGYGTPVETMQEYLGAVWKKAAADSRHIDGEQNCRIELTGNDDHAAVWRLSYVLKSPYGMLSARNAVNLVAYELQQEHGVDVSTPLTHIVTAAPETLRIDAVRGDA